MGNLTDFFPAPASNNVIEVIEGVADGRTVTVNNKKAKKLVALFNTNRCIFTV